MVDGLSLWELAVASQGFRKANSSEETIEPLTVEEYEADMAAAANRTIH